MQPVLGLPDATVAVADPKGDAVVRKMSVKLGDDDTKPEAEKDYLTISTQRLVVSMW